MKQKLQLFIFLLAALFTVNRVAAQISEKGVPASFAFDNSNVLRASKASFVTPIQFDVAKLKAEDKVFEENHLPLRTAMIIPVELDVRNSGEWSTLPNGQQVWTLTINAPNAIATMLYYDEFFIPVGGKLFIYNEDRSHVIGAYTNLTNPANSAFATEFVAGDKITLEYDAPLVAFQAADGANVVSSKPAMPFIKISGIGYGYNYLKVVRKSGDMLRIGESNSCEVNIHCPEGDNWQDQQKGVAKSVTPIGSSSFLCSGTLINNTKQDLTPFFLTASHCFWNGTSTLTSANWNQTLYYFHYESPTCATAVPDPAIQRTVTGSQMLVESRLNGGSDGVLLKLNSSIPLDWDLYFNGWDRKNTPATSGVGIHHPAGDIKKISTFTTSATSSTANMNTGERGATNAHWQVIFSQTPSGWGQTEGGSSGSPLFNQNGLVVGSLTGGNSGCDNLTGTNIYGKLFYHWDCTNQATVSSTGADPSKTMKDYLDPDDTGVETLNGTYTLNHDAVADFSANSTDIYVLESITYTNHSVGANKWTWTFEGGDPATYDGKTPPPVTYNTAGDFVTTLVTNEGTGPQETKTMNIHVALKGTPEQPVANFLLPTVAFNEGFNSSSISSSWAVENGATHASPNKWAIGNTTPNFNTIDPSSLYSAVIQWNAAKSDTWLKTANSYSISNASSIEFYACYDGTYLPNATLNFLVSEDNGSTWTQLWTAGSVAISRSMSWSRYSFDLSAYDGKDLKFAWQYVGTDGNSMAVDGIKLFGGSTQTTINVGDFLTPTDQSTGTPVLWNWTFDGATPSAATGQAPRVQYMTAGTYNITLKVTNTLGTDTKTVTNAVTVVDQLAVVSFTATSPGSYTMQENYGPYITPHHTVDFVDKTKNYPTSWEWTFDGGIPANSTAQNPQGISYDASGSFDVTLTATNTAGTQPKTVSGFVKAGFNDPTRIWNLMPGETESLPSYSSAAVFGSTAYGGSMFSERFDAPMVGGYVSKVDIKCLKTNNSSGNMTVALYSDNNGLPGTQMGTATANVAISSIPTASSLTGLAYTTVTFPTPVLVTGAFHIRISGLNSSGSGSSGRYVYIASAASRGALAKNTAYIYYSNAWRPASGIFTDLNTSLDIVPYFAYSSNTNVDFDAEPAYTLKSNNNPYIPTYASLNFTDLSTGMPPNAWNWTFDGADPATSTEQNPQVVFETSGNHDVSLSVTNSEGGAGSTTKTGFVKSIYDEYNAIWNMLRGETGTSVYTWSSGNYVSGPNSYGLTDFAERFDAPTTAGKISKVDILFYRSGTPSGTLTISIAKDEGGFPGTVLASKTLAANTTNFPSNNATRTVTIDFSASPVFVDGAYYIVVSGYTGTTGGVRSIAICTAADRGEGGKNTFYYYDKTVSSWLDVSEDAGLFSSLNIAPYFAYTSDITAGFIAENGYTRQTNYGQFIPTDASLNFTDNSHGVPMEWNWTFAGGNPGSSTETNPQGISYNTDGEFAVDLSVKNLAKVSDDVQIANFVKVGYDTPEKIWNMLQDDAGEQLLDIGLTYGLGAGYGFFTGSNIAEDKAFAERFDAPLASGYISDASILFNSTVGSGTLTVSIQKETGGLPEEILVTKDLSVSDISNTGYTTVTFDKPVYTDGAFYVVVSGFDQWTDGIGILSSDILPASAKNTAFVQSTDDDWQPVLASWGESNSLSLNIVPTFTYSIPTFSVDGESPVDRKDIDAAVATVTVTSSVSWTATTTASWVTIADGSGDSDGTFTYTVEDNTAPYPRAAKIVVAPVGIESLQKVIIVRQASTHPIGLTAEFENEDVRVNWEQLVSIASTPVNGHLSSASQLKNNSQKLKIAAGNSQLPFASKVFGSRTALKFQNNNIHSNSERTFTLANAEDTDIVITGGKTAEQKRNPISMAKSSLQSTPAETVIRWDSGNNLDAIGISDPSLHNYKLELAALFAPSDLISKQLPSGISYITKIETYIGNLPIDGITLKIRQGNISYQQKVSNAQLSSTAFNTITLDNPFLLDDNSDTYIGYETNIDGGMFVFGIDEGPAVAGKGDLIAEEGGPFYSLYDATGGGLDGNWNIAAVVETGKLDNYIVYRDNAPIGQTIDPTYLDTEELSLGEHCYQVSAVYDGLESTLSNEGCIISVSSSNVLFTPSLDQIDFASHLDYKDVTVEINDPDDYISTHGLNFYFAAPEWVGCIISGNLFSFVAGPNTTGVVRTGVIQIWLGTEGSTFDANNGYEILITQRSDLFESMLNYSFADAIYTGTAHPASVTLNSNFSGLGAITVLYNGSATAPVDAGNYEVSINAASGVNFDEVEGLYLGNFTINPVGLTIRPDDVNRPYGAANPDFTFSFAGMVNRDSQASLDGLTATTTATASSLPGDYLITAGGALNSNYTITYEEGTLTIAKLDQTITSQSVSEIEAGSVAHLNASASSGLAVTYTSSDPAIAEVASDGTITAKAKGTVSITISQSGNEIYNAAPVVTINLVVADFNSINLIASQSITVYPNPAAKSAPVFVKADIDENLLVGAVITIYDAKGSIVKNVEVTGKLTKIDLSGTPGAYFFTLKGKEGVIKNMKVIVK